MQPGPYRCLKCMTYTTRYARPILVSCCKFCCQWWEAPRQHIMNDGPAVLTQMQSGCHNVGLQLGISFGFAPRTPHLTRRDCTARSRACTGVRSSTGRSHQSSSIFTSTSDDKRYATRAQDNVPLPCQETRPLRTAPNMQLQAA